MPIPKRSTSPRATSTLQGGSESALTLNGRLEKRTFQQYGHSGSIPAAFTMSAHFLVSETTYARNSSGVLVSGSIPALSNVSSTPLSSIAALIALLSLSTMGLGVLLGTNAANHPIIS